MRESDRLRPPGDPTATQRITQGNILPTVQNANELQAAAVAAANAASDIVQQSERSFRARRGFPAGPTSLFETTDAGRIVDRAQRSMPAERVRAARRVPGDDLESVFDNFLTENSTFVRPRGRPAIPATPARPARVGGFTGPGARPRAGTPRIPAVKPGAGEGVLDFSGHNYNGMEWDAIRKRLNILAGGDGQRANQYRLLANAIREETAERLGSRDGAAYLRHLSDSHNLNKLGQWVEDQSLQGWGGLAAGWFGASALGALAPLYGGYGQGPSDLLQAGLGAGLGTQFTSGGRARLGGLLTRAGVGPNVANLFRGLSAGLSSAPRTQNLSPQNALPPAPQTTPPVNPPAGVPLGSLRGGVRRRQQLPVGAGPTPTATTPLGSPENPLELTLTSSPQARRRRPGR